MYKRQVYYSEVKVKKYSDMMKVIPSLKKECLELNPKIKCTKPPYEFCEYLDKEHKETDIMICRYEAVESIGKESARIKFKKLPATKALSLFYSHQPDIVILDLGLPDIDGLEVIQEIRKISSKPIIVVSARLEEQEKIKALDLGANDYVVKPFYMGELLACLLYTSPSPRDCS